MALAHIRNGVLIQRFPGESGWLTCEDGAKVSPPQAGFVRGNDRVVEITEVTDDTSTGDHTVSTSEAVITEDSVTITTTIRDKTVEERRAEATLTRAEFLKACVAAGIISAAVAKEAASGAWPEAFNTFLADLPDDAAIDAMATWADGKNVRRNNPLLDQIRVAAGATPEQLDTMFGIGG